MADSKITALASIGTGTDPANDPLVIVDVSDVSPGGMSATGTTKKVTLNNLLACSPTATLASATITGDLTVDTSTLKVDSANNRVGIGTATPVNTLEVVAPAGDNIVSTFRSGDATAANNAGGGFRSISSATAANRVAQVWLDADGANFSGGDYFFIQKNGGSGTVEFNQSSNAAMVFLTNSTERMRIDSSGNVGIGVAPSAWQTGTPAVQLKYNSSIWSNSDNTIQINQNAYFDGSSWKYVNATSLQASNYFQYNGSHSWRTAPSGTAGNAITWTQAMTLDASGKLILGTTGAYNAARLTVQSAGGVGGINTSIQNDNDSYYAINFRNSSGVSCGSISCLTSSTAFNTSSDYRLKEAVQPIIGALSRVSALKPSIYKWKVDGSSGEGFLAHELAEVVPFAVTGEKDAVNEDGSIKPQGVDLSKIVPVLVAAIQELTARVQTLETR